MPWCPNCKEEYKTGIMICPDCNTELVESLEPVKKATDFVPVFTFETKDLADKFASYLSYSGIMAVQSENEDNTVTISVRENEIKKAKKYFAAFYSVEATNALEKEFAEMKETAEKPVDINSYGEAANYYDGNELTDVTREQELNDALDEVICTPEAYERRAEKAAEALYTGITFAIFGGLGLVLVLLGMLNIIPMFHTVMFAVLGIVMFTGFLFVSYSSFKHHKQYLAEAVEEEQLTGALTGWLEQNFTEEILKEIRTQSEINGESDEICYFKIIGRMKQMIVAEFGNIDDSYLDYLTDEYYTKHIELGDVNIIDTIDE